MAKLYTRKGDDGFTDLFGGTRVCKNHLRVEAYGTIDELNAQLGVCLANLGEAAGTPFARMAERMALLQHDLFIIGAELATTETSKNRKPPPTITSAEVVRLENWIDEATQALPPIKTFILPGGHPGAASLHLCRTICRRAERCAIAVAQTEDVERPLIQYLNRLGDLFFAWARQANHLAGIPDVPWERPQA